MGNRVILAIIDTGGARTMIDRKAAEKLNLPIDKATRKHKYGSFWGPGGVQTWYYGRIAGPIKLQVAENVILELGEIKVLEHGEPLFLIGTDSLSENLGSGNSAWRFCWVGLHPVHRRG